MKRAILAAALALTAAASAAGTKAELTREGDAYLVSAGFETAASTAAVFAVLTDYEAMPRFVSSMESSRVLCRHGSKVVLLQRGSGRFLWVRRSVALTLEVEEAPGRVSFREVGGGAFKTYEGDWVIAPAPGGSAVRYRLTAEPDRSLGPRFAARSVLARDVGALIDELRRELDRRAAAAKSKEAL
jgi:hypothetical protein